MERLTFSCVHAFDTFLVGEQICQRRVINLLMVHISAKMHARLLRFSFLGKARSRLQAGRMASPAETVHRMALKININGRFDGDQ